MGWRGRGGATMEIHCVQDLCENIFVSDAKMEGGKEGGREGRREGEREREREREGEREKLSSLGFKPKTF